MRRGTVAVVGVVLVALVGLGVSTWGMNNAVRQQDEPTQRIQDVAPVENVCVGDQHEGRGASAALQHDYVHMSWCDESKRASEVCQTNFDPALKKKHMEELVMFADSVFGRLNITWWVDFGTLLGIHRDGVLPMPWDHDADSGYMVTEMERADPDTFRREMSSGSFRLVHYNHGPMFPYKFKIVHKDPPHFFLDMYPWHSTFDTLEPSFRASPRKESGEVPVPLQYVFPIQRIAVSGTSGVLHLPAPAEVERFLDTRYDPSWRDPVPSAEYHPEWAFGSPQMLRLAGVERPSGQTQSSGAMEFTFVDAVQHGREWCFRHQLECKLHWNVVEKFQVFQELLLFGRRVLESCGFQEHWIDFGTLLGMARGGAPLPWDVNVDISFLVPPQPDVENAVACIRSHESERVRVSIADKSLKARCTVTQEPWFSLNLYPYQRSQPPSNTLTKFRWDVIPDPAHPENVDLLEQDVLPLSSSNLAMFGSTVHVAVPADVISVLRERYGAKWTFPDPPPSYMSEHSPGVLYAAVGGVT